MSVPNSSLHQALTHFTIHELNSDPDLIHLDPAEDLLEDSLIDSLGVMRLVAFIKSETGVTVPPEDMTIENFVSINAIATYLENRLKADGS